MTELEILSEVFDEMVAQATAQAPIEACGILAGRDKKVEKLYRMANVENSSDHFMMEPQEQFAVAKDIRSDGLKMLAIYHSHPRTPARLSYEDVRLSLTPDVIYVILSLQDAEKPDIKGFMIEDHLVIPVALKIVKEKLRID